MADAKKENPRTAIREARLARLKVIDGPPKTIKVYPATEGMRASLRHASGVRFRDTIGQSVDWPNDNFTTRRIAEGSVLLEPGSGKGVKADPNKNARQNAAANKPKKNGKPSPAQRPIQSAPPTPSAPPAPSTPPSSPPPAAA
jgi:hypothetical protein